jgi:hypothetical protein
MLRGGQEEWDRVNQAMDTMIQINSQIRLKGRFFCLKSGASPWLSKTGLFSFILDIQWGDVARSNL